MNHVQAMSATPVSKGNDAITLIVDDFGFEVEVPELKPWVVDDYGSAVMVEGDAGA